MQIFLPNCSFLLLSELLGDDTIEKLMDEEKGRLLDQLTSQAKQTLFGEL